MGMERLTMIVQGVDNSYETDLFTPIMDRIQSLAGHTKAQRAEHLTAYRVIADHTRAATFLIADGVVPGNTGRNYVTRMVIRRAGRFGSKAGFTEPFLGKVAETVIDHYRDVYPEIVRARPAILRTITDEERRFQRTVDTGVSHLMSLIEQVRQTEKPVLDGERAFDLYATYGLPLEITRDIAREYGTEVDEPGFRRAMEDHRLASGAGQAMGELGGESVDVYREVFESLRGEGKLAPEGVGYDPYGSLEAEGPVLALVRDGSSVEAAEESDEIAVVLPRTPFYLEAGGQVSDTGTIVSVREPRWEIAVTGVVRPAAGVIAHLGRVTRGRPRLGDTALAAVDEGRRWDIMRNHTATHLLHAALRSVLGEHVRQAGSLVAPDRLRFDFTHPQAMTPEEIERVGEMVNDEILGNHRLAVVEKPREDAVAEGAMALFGETYGETVRTVSIGAPERLSYELCGGTHVPETGVLGTFVIVSEGSVAAGVRRIEALTGRGALAFLQARLGILDRLAARLDSAPEAVEERIRMVERSRQAALEEAERLRADLAAKDYETLPREDLFGSTLVSGSVSSSDSSVLRGLTDRFFQTTDSGVIVLGSIFDDAPVIVAGVSSDLVKRGVDAASLVKEIAPSIGGGGGGKPTLAQAGGKDPSRLQEALERAREWVRSHLK
jgi:alanyl-tRNA synthetase